MQDVQNIPAPDANPNTIEEDFDSHAHDYPDVPDEDNTRDSVEDIPLPPDQKPVAAIEEPPTDSSADVERIA
ncbi:hypothetical protein BH20ACI4_BH20ACI4_21610 [soil metagenome]